MTVGAEEATPSVLSLGFRLVLFPPLLYASPHVVSAVAHPEPVVCHVPNVQVSTMVGNLWWKKSYSSSDPISAIILKNLQNSTSSSPPVGDRSFHSERIHETNQSSGSGVITGATARLPVLA